MKTKRVSSIARSARARARDRSRIRVAKTGELAGLRVRMVEAEETLRAIRTGEVDAVVTAGKAGLQVFTLQDTDHAYRTLIESMNEGALTLTADNVILYANACFARMVKCPLEQVIGGSFRRFLSAEDGAVLRPLLKRPAKSGAKIQAMLLTGDGTPLPVQISLRRLARHGFKSVLIGMVVTDLTESRRAASQQETARLYAQVCEHAAELERRVDERTGQLLRTNQELEAFQSSVSHDLRAPLRHVMGFSQILLETCGPQLPEEARGFLQKILDGAGNMERMIVALLEFSRLSHQPVALQLVDVGRLWREILAEMAPAPGDRRVEVTIGELPSCHADPVLLRHVLVNLLENALKYSRTRDPSVIAIAAVARPNGAGAIYSIKDNGVGFDMANADRLFTVFARLHAAGDFEGTGVGLTTVQRIVHRHGGRIWAESVAEAGATFFFELGPAPPEPTRRGASRLAKAARKRRQ